MLAKKNNNRIKFFNFLEPYYSEKTGFLKKYPVLTISSFNPI